MKENGAMKISVSTFFPFFPFSDCRLSPLSEVFDLSSALHFSARLTRLIAHISRNHKQLCLYATT